MATLAPAPDPVTPDYARKAARAELRIAKYLWTTDGFRTSSSKGIGELSKGEGYARFDEVKGIVSATLGKYATANKPKQPYAIRSRMVRRG